MTWPMAGFNPQRTSWSSETPVEGSIGVTHIQRFDSYIHYGFPPVVHAASDLILTSHQDGMSALAAADVAHVWTFATAMPAGHSPTVDTSSGLIYFPCMDRKLYCLNASGVKQWAYDSATYPNYGGGWRTNPLVVGGYVYAGNDDGYLYKINASTGALAWRFQTGGPVRFSPAAKVDNSVIYFASDDGKAYAVNASTGVEIWSTLLLSAGFTDYWPVVWRGYVVFAGAYNMRESIHPQVYTNPRKHLIEAQLHLMYPGATAPMNNIIAYLQGTVAGDWETGATTLDVSQQTTNPTVTAGIVTPLDEYFEDDGTTNPTAPGGHKHWQRSIFVLDADTGVEFTADPDGDTYPSYLPVSWQGTHAGNRTPPLVGQHDDVLYMSATFQIAQSIGKGGYIGWDGNDIRIFRLATSGSAADEPLIAAGAGPVLYESMSCNRREAFARLNVSGTPTKTVWVQDNTAGTGISMEVKATGYDWGYENADKLYTRKQETWHGPNNDSPTTDMDGIYGTHGAQSPFIVYNGAMYGHRGGSIIRATNGGSGEVLHTVIPRPTPTETISIPASAAITAKLEAEVTAMIAAGPLRPGHVSSGFVEVILHQHYAYFFDYFSNPSEIVILLLRVRPFLNSTLQASLDIYITTNYGPGGTYDFLVYSHVGWDTGAAREPWPLVYEVQNALSAHGKKTTESGVAWTGTENTWTFNPIVFYAAWKYAAQYGGTSTIVSTLEAASAKMDHLNPAWASYPPDTGTISLTTGNFTPGFDTHPWHLNAYLAGYKGYIELKILNSQTASSTITDEYARLLALRVSQWNEPSPWPFVSDSVFYNDGYYYQRQLNMDRQTLFLQPEIADYLRANASTEVNSYVSHYELLAPYWFASRFGVTFSEGAVQPLYTSHGLMKAKAWIQQQSVADLAKYLSAPAVALGDLFTMDNMADVLSAGATIGTVSIDDATPDLYAKVTLSIDTITTVATDYQFPYDASVPANVVQDNGITVDLVVTTPGSATKRQPFYYKGVDIDDAANFVPIVDGQWYCHLSPDESGTWTYYVEVTDASGTVTTPTAQFVVSATPVGKGAIVQSATDSRYWEYADGDLFVPAGPNLEYNEVVGSWTNPVSGPAARMAELADCNMIRMFLPMWMIQGAQEHLWLHGHRVSPSTSTDPALRFEGQAETSYDDGTFTTTTDHVLQTFDNHGAAIRFTDEEKGIRVNRTQFVKVKPSTTYRVFIRYAIPVELVGPADATNIYGLSLKFTNNVWADGNGTPLYYDYNTGTRLWGPFYLATGLDVSNNVQWAEEVDTFVTGASQTHLTHLYLTHENVTTLDGHTQGTPHWTNLVYVDEIRIEEDLGGGAYGPNVLTQSSFNLVDKFNEVTAARFDRFLAACETAGMTVKLSINEKQEPIFRNLNPATGAYVDWDAKSLAFFYGNPGVDWTVQNNKVRWLQAAWWRYVQARWGYSTSIHSWELLNEGSGNPGDGVDDIHYHLAAIFAGKMTKAPDGTNWVNIHPVTTSFNQHMAFPVTNLYEDATKPGSAYMYGDTHNYTYANTETAQYNDELVDYAAMVTALPSINAPKMQGEFAFSAVSGNETPNYALLNLDTDGTWHRNRLWAMMFSPEPIFFQIWYYKNTIVNGTVDHLHHYGNIQTFFAGIPLSNGNYVDAAATTNMAAGAYAVYGQKDLTNNAAHLFVRADGATPATWLNKANAASITACTGDIAIAGLADGDYTVQAIDVDDGATALATATVTASTGLTITPADFAVLTGLQDAVLFKITATAQVAPAAPTNLTAVRI